MKTHHRAGLLVGCFGLFVLYLPAGARIVGGWPSRPALGVVPLLPGTSVANLSDESIDLEALPAPRNSALPVNLDDLSTVMNTEPVPTGGQ